MKEKYDNQDLEIFFGYYKLDIVWYGQGNNKEDYDVDIKQTLAKASNERILFFRNSILLAKLENAILKGYEYNY